MPMPNRQMIGGELYRYAFQGQEKDPETGKEAFQLRLWDSRIGRWLTTDPAGQYSSPYLGMGNNPINGVDPDGAFWEELGNWIGGNGWNSNGALEFQANGGVLGDWIGNKFSGHRRGTFSPEGGGAGIASFGAVDDFMEGIMNPDAFGFNGKVAIGTIGQGSGDYDFMIGAGGAVNKTSLMFMGGKYGGFWYDYLGIEGGSNVGFAIGGSAEVSKELFIAVYNGENNSPHPGTMEGPYTAIALNAEIYGGIGGGGFYSLTNSGDWRIHSLGISVGVGGHMAGNLQMRMGTTKMITPVMITDDRSIKSMMLNHFIHFMTD